MNPVLGLPLATAMCSISVQRLTVYVRFVDQARWLNWRLVDRKQKKEKGAVLRLERVPHDLEEAKGLVDRRREQHRERE